MIDAKFTYCDQAKAWYFDLARGPYSHCEPNAHDKFPDYIVDFSSDSKILGVEVLNSDITLRELSTLLLFGKL